MSIVFPDDLQLIFVGLTVGMKKDGIMESIIRKIKFIEDNWKHRPILLTANYNLHLGYNEARLSEETKEEGQTRLNPDTRVFGVFDYFLNSYPYNQSLEVLMHPKRGDKTLQYKEIEPSVFDVFRDGTLVRREHFTAFGSEKLSQIDLFNAGNKLTKSLFYDYLGYMTKAVIWDTEKPDYHPVELYYTTDKKLRLRAEYNYIEEPHKSKVFATRTYRTPNELTGYTIYDNDGNEIVTVPTHQHLLALCLDGITSNPGMKYIICDECHLYGGSGLVFPKENVANATVIHSTFLNDPYDLKSEPQQYYKQVCEDRKKYDAIIHLTKESKDDFEKKYGVSKRLYVITHPYPFPIEKADFEKRDHKRAIVTARLFKGKRVKLAVEVFALALQEAPDARLDIYGFGPEQENIQALIDRLGIGESVRINDYTDKVTKIMSESACYLMTSGAEGLGLVLLECTSNGCPGFAFDIKYGPSHIIKHNVTGFVFKNNDKRAFAKQLAKYFNDTDMQKRMSENCYDHAPRFGVQAFLDKYWEMTSALYQRMK